MSALLFPRHIKEHVVLQGAPALLGVTDDVDCAVLRLAVSAERRIVADHVVSIPALAYVAAGKVQRRAVVLGQPGEPCSSDCLLCASAPRKHPSH